MKQFSRKKDRIILVSYLYKFSKFFLGKGKRKFQNLLRREWVYKRLALEESFKYYNIHQHPLYRSVISFLSDYISSDTRILDFGCKYGHLGSMMSDLGSIVDGIDHDLSAIKEARVLYKNKKMNFFHGDAFDFLDNSVGKYDIIILSHILEHLDNPEFFLKKIKGKAKYIYIDLPDFEASFLNLFRDDINDKLSYEDADHIFEFCREDLIDLFVKTGYHVIKAEYRFGMQKYMLN